jgi:hypothetical protein
MGLAAPMWIFQNSTSVCCLSYWAPSTKKSFIFSCTFLHLNTTITTSAYNNKTYIVCWMVALQIPSSKFENLMKLWCFWPRQNMFGRNLNVQAHFELLMCKHKVFIFTYAIPLLKESIKNPLLPFEICLAILFCCLNRVESSNLEIVLKGALSLHNKV